MDNIRQVSIMDGADPNKKAEVTDSKSLSVRDLQALIGSESIMKDVLKELKKMNLYLSIMTDIEIEDKEV